MKHPQYWQEQHPPWNSCTCFYSSFCRCNYVCVLPAIITVSFLVVLSAGEFFEPELLLQKVENLHSDHTKMFKLAVLLSSSATSIQQYKVSSSRRSHKKLLCTHTIDRYCRYCTVSRIFRLSEVCIRTPTFLFPDPS
jgi:hypothetical protein